MLLNGKFIVRDLENEIKDEVDFAENARKKKEEQEHQLEMMD